jgi:aryl-alcohol dehydrogenase-like predicted oxidoreductase
MEETVLGRTGLRVTAAGLGCGGFSRIGMFTKGLDNAVEIILSAYDQGVNFFDTAVLYGTQPALGKAFRGMDRQSYVLSSKIPYSGENGLRPPGDLEKMLDASLRELETDYIDVFHIHGVAPEDYPAVRDRFYPVLSDMRRKGKIRFPGITEIFGTDTAHKMLKAALSDDLWDVIMVGYSIINPSAAKTILPLTMERNVGTLCMFAVRTALSYPAQLKADILAMLEAGQVDEGLVKGEKTLDFLEEKGYAGSLPEAAYRFCRHTKGIDVTLTGTGDLTHLKENLRSLSLSPLPPEALAALEELFGRVDCVSGQPRYAP